MQTISKTSTQKQLFTLTNSCLLQLGSGMIFHVKPNKLTINSFKYFLTRERERAPMYYYTGKRLCQIHHTRLWTNCSSLNYNLFSKHITYHSVVVEFSLLLRMSHVRTSKHLTVRQHLSISCYLFTFYCFLYRLQKTLTYLTKYRNLSKIRAY